MKLTVEQTAFIELLKASLFQYDVSVPNDTKWDRVLDIAKAQCVLALIEPVVTGDQKEDWLESAYQSRASFLKILYEQTELIKLLNDSNISYVIIKGTAAAMYYPKPTHRTMGDIDFVVKPDDYSKACELLKNNGYRFSYTNDRHAEYEKHGVAFELHKKVSSDYCRDIEPVIVNGFQNAKEYRIGDSCFMGLPTNENGVVLLNHILKHIKRNGIGFRQIIDWMMFVDKELDDNAWNSGFQQLACDAGLQKTAITVTWMCKKWLGLSKNIKWCDGADDRLADSLLEQIFSDGNFAYSRSPGDTIMKNIKSEGLFGYLQRGGVDNWTAAQRHSFLRPLAWLYQLVRYMFKGVIGLITGKRIFRGHIQGMTLEEIRERLED